MYPTPHCLKTSGERKSDELFLKVLGWAVGAVLAVASVCGIALMLLGTYTLFAQALS